MAVDTRDKRMSMIGFGSGPLLMEDPDATDDAPGRLMLLNLYSGITIQEAYPTLLFGVTQTLGTGSHQVWFEEGMGEQTSVDRKLWAML